MRKLSLSELGRLSPEQFVSHERNPVVFVLDNVRSGLNVGSVFRTADAFALEKIMLCGITPQPPHREILKTALGATESVRWEYFPSCSDAVQQLLDEGFEVWPVEQTDQSISLDLFSLSEGKSYAFIFGNEVEGVSEDVLSLCTQSLEIPQFGTKHSLNVAVTAGIVAWQTLKHFPR